MLNAKSKPDFSKIKRVGFLGFGRAASGAYDFLRENYPHLTYLLRDERSRDSFPDFFKACYSGNDAFNDINEDILFLSPSVRRDRPQLIEAEKNGVTLYSDLELYLDNYSGLSFGVTGSDGKSTTTYLLAQLLKGSDINAVPCGNFGLSPCRLLNTKHIPVLELSSFQLSAVSPKLSCAIITNINENHLDWHKSYEEYILAKLSILKDSERAVFDYDCVKLRENIKDINLQSLISMKLDYKDFCKLLFAEYYVTLENGFICTNGEPLIEVEKLIRKEEYNIKNMMLAIGAAYPYVSNGIARSVFEKFTGLPHRAQLIAALGTFRFVNSSIDTTPERADKTIRQISGDCVVILCGRGKGLSLGELPNALLEFTKGAVLMGEFGKELYFEISGNSRFKSYPVNFANDMKDAVIKAMGMLSNGATVLLSPGATSYDKYENFEMRGEDFKRCVNSL